MKYDLVIIGAGIAGVTAAVYAKRSNLNVIIIEKGLIGGLLNNIDNINNYPGFKSIKGSELASLLNEQITNLDIPVIKEEVINIELVGEDKRIVTDENEYLTKAVLISTGRVPKKIPVDNERNLIGKGLSYCATCDGYFFKDKDVAVIGGGNSALDEAIYLSKIVNKVYIVHRRSAFKAEEKLVNEVKNKSNIEIIYNANVLDIIEEDNKISKVILDNEKELKVDGVFVYIGYEPNTNFISRLDISDDRGYILTNGYAETKIKGVFAAGDIVLKEVYQLVTAASEGAIAAININKYIKNHE